MNRSSMQRVFLFTTIALLVALASGCVSPGMSSVPGMPGTVDASKAAESAVQPESTVHPLEDSIEAPVSPQRTPPEALAVSLPPPDVFIDDALVAPTPRTSEVSVLPNVDALAEPRASARVLAPEPTSNRRTTFHTGAPAQELTPAAATNGPAAADVSARPAPATALLPEDSPPAVAPASVSATNRASVASSATPDAPAGPAGGGGPTAPTTTAVPAASADPGETRDSPAHGAGWTERSAAVRAGSEVRIVLPGSGWLYVGTEYGDGDVQLLGKSRSGGDDVFRFRIPAPGDYGLWFQQQNAQTGELSNERLAVAARDGAGATSVDVASLPDAGQVAQAEPVVPGARSASNASDQRANTPEQDAGQRTVSTSGTTAFAAATSGVPNTAAAAGASPVTSGADAIEALVSRGDLAGALAAVAAGVDASQDGAVGGATVARLSDETRTRLVEAARSDARPEVVRSFWRAVASSGTAAAPLARRTLLARDLQAGDAARVASSMRLLEGAGEVIPSDYLAASEIAPESDQALAYLSRAVGSMDDPIVSRLSDERIYRLARFLEQPGASRDLRRSLSLYDTIVTARPLSAWWDRSKARSEFIRRHYLDVR